MLVLSALISSVYWPGIPGAATTPRWALVAIVPWLLREQKLTLSHWVGLVFLGWAILSMAWNPAPLDGVSALFVYLIWAACFCLGSQLESLRRLYAGAAIGMGIVSAFTVAQWLDYRVPQGLHPVHGTFVNPNYMGEAAALILVAVIVERMWWALPLVVPALLLSEARGAMLAVAVALAVHFRRHWRVMLAVAILALIIGGVFTLYKDPGSTPERLLIWESAVRGISIFGRGIGSFWTQYPQFDLRTTPLSFPEQAHNEFLTVAFELGIVGLLLFVIFGLTLLGPLDTPRIVLIALLTESCFAFPLHLPATAFVGLVAAGHAVRNRYLLRDFALCRRLSGAYRSAVVGISIRLLTPRPRRADYAV